MNVKELNESVKENQKSVLEENIKEIESGIRWIASNGLNYFIMATHDDDYYTIRKWMMKPLRDYFENEGYKVEVKEVRRVTKWLQKLLGIYEPDYIIIISWEEINEPLELLKKTIEDISENTNKVIKECDKISKEINDKLIKK